ncbi:MAG: TonB-dependent receptor [Bacteroidales bacterium]|nr:TonB-dependent receptor [Bacteroidales bacterium]MDD3665858.1 TonB-dependent receptor [Bacteroidales bacterium]
MRYLYKTSVLLLLLALPTLLHSQRGTIKGVVKDQKSGETLPGVNVYLQDNPNFGASTDLDGNYTIINIPKGTYNLIASSLSFKTETIRGVVVAGSRNTVVNIKLSESVSEIEGVTIVAAKRTDSDISMISTIKQNNLVVNGISAQQISRSQDKDASEVIRRVPGITIMDDRFVVVRGLTERYNSVMLNSTSSPSTETDQRAFSFDVIPSNMIDNILVYKTPAPELPTDFAGAAIQIFTKNTTDENHFGVSYQASYQEGSTFKDFYSYKGGGTDWLGFDNGSRQLPSIVPSTEEMHVLQTFSDGLPLELVAARKAKLTEIARSFNKTSTATKSTAPFDNKIGVDLTFQKKLGKLKINNITSLNYKYGFSTNQIFKATYQAYDEIKDSSIYTYKLTDDIYAQKVQLGGIHNWAFSTPKSVYEFRNLVNQIGNSRTILRNSTDYYRNGNKVKAYELGYSSRLIYSGQVSGTHRFSDDKTKINWNLGYSFAGKDEPDVRRIYTYATRTTDTAGNEIYLPYVLDYAATVNTESNGRLFSYTGENIYTASVNFSRSLDIQNWTPEIKAGIFVEDKNRGFDLRTFGMARAVPSMMFNNSILSQPLDSIYADTNFNYFNGVKLEENTAPEYSYKATTKTYAGYIAVKIPVGNRINIYGGVRAESFYRKLSDFQSEKSTDPDIVADTFAFYPSVNLSYSFTNRSLIRFSYGQTVNRPEYREIAPYAFYDFEQSATIYGNKDLKDSYVKNYDARFEFYPTLAEMVSLGVFYKTFTNPIELNLFPSSNGWDFVAVNSIKAESYGFEMELRKSLAFLTTGFTGRFFDNLSVSLNASYIEGTVEKEDGYVRDKKRVLFGQSPYIVNAGLYYIDAETDLSVSILYNVIGKRLVVVGTPTIPNVFEHPRHIVDFTVSKRIGTYWSLKAGVKDLFNSEVIYRQTFDVTIDGNTVQRIQDMKRFTPGRSFSVTLSYSF